MISKSYGVKMKNFLNDIKVTLAKSLEQEEQAINFQTSRIAPLRQSQSKIIALPDFHLDCGKAKVRLFCADLRF